jgi:hypothetical protein
MSRLLSLVLLLATSVPLFAQTAQLKASVDPALAIVDANALMTFQTFVASSGNVQATDIRVVYSIDGEAAIELIEAHAGWTCAIAGQTAECTIPYSGAEDTIQVTVRAGGANGGASKLTMTVTHAQPADGSGANISQATLQSFQTLAVETTADAGVGSLRAAIETANGLTKPAKIEFHLPPPVPAEGWFTIVPASPLPPITADRAVVDGTSQTRFTGDTNPRGPEIAIDGHLAHFGLEIHSPCLARVTGLALGNFDANQGLWFTKSGPCTTNLTSQPDGRLVADNYIGTDPTGTVAWPNLRGLRGDFGSGTIRNNVISGNTYSGMWIWLTEGRFDSFLIEENRIGTAADGVTPLPNGAAGILFGPRVSADVVRNVIANHPGMGIALVRGETYVDIRRNSMRDNGGIGIDWGIDGVSPADDADASVDPNAPVLLGARYDPELNRTYFAVTVSSERPGADGSDFDLDFYANHGPDGDGEQWIGEGFGGGERVDGRVFEVWVAGDHHGKWVNATSTRSPVFFIRPPQISSEAAHYGEGSTSEFSNAILVP